MTGVSWLGALVFVATPAFAQEANQESYMTNCSACHQPTGQGIKGAFPALAGDAFVDAAPGPVVAVVLNGRGQMPPFKADLTDAQVAAAVNYIRSAWGNSAPAVTPAAVAAARAALAAH